MSTNYIVMAFNYRPGAYTKVRHALMPKQHHPVLTKVDNGWFIYKYEPGQLLMCLNSNAGVCVLVAPLEQDKSLDVVAIEILIDEAFFPNIHRRLKTHAKR